MSAGADGDGANSTDACIGLMGNVGFDYFLIMKSYTFFETS
jgi:hypothetical protein